MGIQRDTGNQGETVGVSLPLISIGRLEGREGERNPCNSTELGAGAAFSPALAASSGGANCPRRRPERGNAAAESAGRAETSASGISPSPSLASSSNWWAAACCASDGTAALAAGACSPAAGSCGFPLPWKNEHDPSTRADIAHTVRLHLFIKPFYHDTYQSASPKQGTERGMLHNFRCQGRRDTTGVQRKMTLFLSILLTIGEI